MMDNIVVGNLCGDPVFRQTKRGGRPMARFVVAVNRRRRSNDEFVDFPPVFHRIVCFGGLAENVNNSLRKGMEVLVVGEWVDDSYSDEQGQKRSQIALEARTIGAGLRWATASVAKVARTTTGSPAGSPNQAPIMAEIGGTSETSALTGNDRELAGVGAAPAGASGAGADGGA